MPQLNEVLREYCKRAQVHVESVDSIVTHLRRFVCIRSNAHIDNRTSDVRQVDWHFNKIEADFFEYISLVSLVNGKASTLFTFIRSFNVVRDNQFLSNESILIFVLWIRQLLMCSSEKVIATKRMS